MIRKVGFIVLSCMFGLFASVTFAENFDAALYDSLQGEADGATVWERLETNVYQFGGSAGSGITGEGIRDFLIRLGTELLIPILIFVGLIIAIIGFYKLMIADDKEELSKASYFLLRGVVGIIIMISAGFIVDTLVGVDEATPFQGGANSIANVISSGAGGGEIAEAIYNQLLYPFLGLIFDILIGVMFIFVLIEAFTYLSSPSEDVQKNAVTLLLYSAIGTITIILAKALVELVYGQYSEVVNGGVTALDDIGTGALEQGSQGLALFYTVINWVLGLASFLVLIILIVQGYQLLINPSDEEQVQTITKNLGYIFIGILVVGASYLIVNFFLVTY